MALRLEVFEEAAELVAEKDTNYHSCIALSNVDVHYTYLQPERAFYSKIFGFREVPGKGTENEKKLEALPREERQSLRLLMLCMAHTIIAVGDEERFI